MVELRPRTIGLRRIASLANLSALTLLLSSISFAQETDLEADRAAGEADFKVFCAACHEGALLEAPGLAALKLYSPNRIIESLESGVMATQGMNLSGNAKRQMALFLTGKEAQESVVNLASFSCSPTRQNHGGLTEAISWNGWGGNLSNSRHQAEETTLTKDNVSSLELKWAFAIPGATRSRAQPVVTPEITYVGSQSGMIFALDTANGCPLWTFQSDSEVRGSLFVDTDPKGIPQTLFFGDFDANAYAIDAQSGELEWKTSVHDNPMATVTGSVISHDNVVIVPVSSLEIIPAARDEYECCSFRGAIAAVDKNSGELLWRTYTVDQPRPTIKNRVGTQQYGPSGAPVWSGPTIDTKRSLVYATTGQNYSSPASGTSDAVIAMDLQTGEVKWVTQVTANDAWNGACSRRTANCPEENGPDYDIGASAILATAPNGKELILIGQKSGMVYALDPNDDGAIVWETRMGSGGTMGGVHYGMSADSTRLYVGVSDLPTNNPGNVGDPHPGIHALDLNTGEFLWRNDLPDVCEESPFLCWRGISAAISSSPGLVFGGGIDGMFRVFDADTGQVLWETNTRKSFGEANGIPAMGGSIEADGPVIADGRIYITSGYEKWAEAPGNLVLVYGPAEQPQ